MPNCGMTGGPLAARTKPRPRSLCTTHGRPAGNTRSDFRNGLEALTGAEAALRFRAADMERVGRQVEISATKRLDLGAGVVSWDCGRIKAVSRSTSLDPESRGRAFIEALEDRSLPNV